MNFLLRHHAYIDIDENEVSLDMSDVGSELSVQGIFLKDELHLPSFWETIVEIY